jgi:type II secretion system protein N
MRLPKLTPRAQKAVRIAGYAAFYVFSLMIFAYLTFPYDRLKERIIDEFHARQTGPDAMKLEIDSLDGYYLSGVEAEGIRLISTGKASSADVPEEGAAPAAVSAETVPAKPSVLSIESAHARVGLLPLLVGSIRLSFGAEAFGGSVSGSTSESDGARRISVELEELALGQATLLSDAVGLPLAGTLNGKLELSLPENKLAKAEGTVSMKMEGLSAGDGKAKIRDTIALPKVEAGDLTFEGESTDGQLKVNNFSASGPDLELATEGSVRLRDPMQSSLLNLTARFRFTDRYMGKNEMTRGLFGSPGSSVPGLFDLDPKNKRAKRADGFYGWRVTGSLTRPQFVPHPTGGALTGTKAGR